MLGRGPLAFAPLATLNAYQAAGGILATTLGPATLVGAGIAPAKGSLSATLDPCALVGIGTVRTLQGSLSATLGPLALVGTGTVRTLQGSLSATLGPATLVGIGTVRTLQGSLSVTLGPAALVGIGTVANQVFSGSLSTTLGALSLAGSADLVVTGALDATLGPVVLAGQAKALIQGWLASPVIAYWIPLATAVPLAGPYELQPLSLAAAGTVQASSFAGLVATLSPLTLVATGKATAKGTLGVTLGALGGTLAGKVRVSGSSAGQLFPLMLVGSGTVRNQVFAGSLVSSLGPLALAGAGAITTPTRIGVLGATLGPVTLRGLGRLTGATPAWPHGWCPAPGAGRTSTALVDTVPFGDGYTWRQTRGLNPLRVTLNYDFPFVGIDMLTQMDAFLARYGERGFQFIPPDSSVPIQTCCTEWTATIIDKGSAGVVGTLHAAFEQAYNIQPIQRLAA